MQQQDADADFAKRQNNAARLSFGRLHGKASSSPAKSGTFYLDSPSGCMIVYHTTVAFATNSLFETAVETTVF
ncbi:MAG: hypothetical protein LUG15_06455 [Oscillospiraceae bacterium]|nr:hypothetical protein [Oscillospiraceae bacterium]